MVVDDTCNGAVPVATVEINRDPVSVFDDTMVPVVLMGCRIVPVVMLLAKEECYVKEEFGWWCMAVLS